MVVSMTRMTKKGGVGLGDLGANARGKLAETDAIKGSVVGFLSRRVVPAGTGFYAATHPTGAADKPSRNKIAGPSGNLAGPAVCIILYSMIKSLESS